MAKWDGGRRIRGNREDGVVKEIKKALVLELPFHVSVGFTRRPVVDGDNEPGQQGQLRAEGTQSLELNTSVIALAAMHLNASHLVMECISSGTLWYDRRATCQSYILITELVLLHIILCMCELI